MGVIEVEAITGRYPTQLEGFEKLMITERIKPFKRIRGIRVAIGKTTDNL